jgi:hypothetical protein
VSDDWTELTDAERLKRADLIEAGLEALQAYEEMTPVPLSGSGALDEYDVGAVTAVVNAVLRAQAET